MEYLSYETLYNCDGQLVPGERAFKNKLLIGFFFSAAWSPECKKFTPLLRQVYQENVKKKFGLEIIYVSMDNTEEEFLTYFKNSHFGWFAAKFKDPLAEEMRFAHEVTTIPQIVVLKTSDGTVVTKNGKEEVEKLGKNALVAWSS